ncbi:transposase [Peribacillus frigoritolerans]|uniref:transposase n=1 Tax=Peribacillus frigoritolerans TaxID=450367 RepID=UPI00361946B1
MHFLKQKKDSLCFDEHFDCYLCSSCKTLKSSTTNKEVYREYKSPKQICTTYSYLSRYRKQGPSKGSDTTYLASICGRSRSLLHHQGIKPIYAKRKETIERIFSDAKEKHVMRWTTLRGLKNCRCKPMLTFAAINLKKMATWTWQGPKMA